MTQTFAETQAQLAAEARRKAEEPRRRTLLDGPREGWLSLILILGATVSVTSSVNDANWVSTMPPLWPLGVAAVLMGMAASRIPGPWIIGLLLGLLAGLPFVLLTGLASIPGETLEGRWETAGLLLTAWLDVVREGGTSRDPTPFVLFIGSLTWLTAFLGGFATFRWHSAWAALTPLGIGLVVNLSYLPGQLEGWFFLFLVCGILLAIQLHRVNQRQAWRTGAGVVNRSSDTNYLVTAGTWGILLALFVLLVPPGRPAPQLNDIWLAALGPYAEAERQFERVFGALAPARASQLHEFGDAFAFRGGLGDGAQGSSLVQALNQTIVMAIEAERPQYWRGRVYSLYGPAGWEAPTVTAESLPDVTQAPGSVTPEEVWEYRQEFTQVIEVARPTEIIFAAGEPQSVSRQAIAQVAQPPVVALSLADPARNRALPPALQEAAASVAQSVDASGRLPTPGQVQSFLPDDLRLLSLQATGNRLVGITVTRIPAAPAEIVGTRATGRIGRGETYTVTSSVSVAPIDKLQEAGTDYPGWVTDTYLQLPPQTPDRVVALAREITTNAGNAYDQSRAIEGYLRQIPFSLAIAPPPPGTDAVDYFLFDAKAGYSDYHASAMVILLRSIGVPARLATGYVGGEFDQARDAYIVRERQGHSWPEVYFPGFGWIEFEPTPALPIIERPLSPEYIQNVLGGVDPSATGDFEPYDPFLDELFLLGQLDNPAPVTPVAQTPLPTWVLPLAIVIVVIAALVVVSQSIWRRSLAGLTVPQQSWVKIQRLAGLSDIGRPRPAETPREYGDRLGQALPDQRDAVSQVTDGYVRTAYGHKDLSDSEQAGIDRAWRRLRQGLFWRIFRRT